MRKLIKLKQESLVICDNLKCDYSVPYTEDNKNDLILFVNKPCPKCGYNLCTMNDYLQYQRIIKIVNFINRWFSWITIFYSKKSLSNEHSISIDVHKK